MEKEQCDVCGSENITYNKNLGTRCYDCFPLEDNE